jgi:hypothetical protein
VFADYTLKMPHYSLSQLREKVAPFAQPLSIICMVASIAVTIFWFFDIPETGKAVALLGGVAVFLALRGEIKEIHGSEKIIWTLIVFVLLWTELKAIDKDHKINADKEAAARAEQLANFRAIGNGINTTIKQSQQQFDASMGKANQLLDSTQKVSNLAQENLATITGKGSHPCIVPQSHAAGRDGAIPLVVWNRGVVPLTGVEIRLLSQSEFLDGESLFHKPSVKIDTLRLDWPKPLPESILPTPGGDGVAHYTAEIWTQNGYYVQVINFRRGKYQLPWAYQYWLNKQTPFLLKASGARGMKGELMADCQQEKWSDDLGDGKPVRQP